MQQQSTDAVRSKEQLCLEVIKNGDIVLNEFGHVLRIRRRTNSGKVKMYPEPRRIDVADHLGYCRFGFGVDGKRYVTYAHRLVWVFHNGPIPEHLEVNHKDGDKTNNRLSNLELVTHRQNQIHAGRVTRSWAGRSNRRGEESYQAKLTWNAVREMRRRWKEGNPRPTFKQLGKIYGVSGVSARCVCLGLTWKEAAVSA